MQHVQVAAYALHISDSLLYAGGSFTTIGGVTRNRIAAFSLANDALKSWNPDANSDIRAFTNYNNTIIAGGYFTTIGGQPRSYLAAINKGNNNATGWNPSLNYICHSLAIRGTTCYAGGDFTTANAVAVNRFASINVSTAAIGSFKPSFPSTVYAITYDAFPDSAMKVGGNFASVNGLPQLYNVSFSFKVGAAPFAREDDEVVLSNANSTQEIKLYPNPVSDVLFIESNVDEDTQIQILNLNGQVVAAYTLMVNNYTKSIPVGDIPAGVSIITMTNTQSTSTGRFIKR